jgi:hypothetical protein
MGNSSNERHNLPPPCRVGLRTSPSTCSVSGNPPFSAIITYTCINERPTWFLITLFSDFASNIIVRDPNHPKGKDRRIGPFPTMQDEWDQKQVDFEDSELVCLGPGESFETAYTFRIEERPLSYERSDVKFMQDGGTYWMELGHRKCWWMCADDVGKSLTPKDIRELLGRRGYVEWQPNCRLHFKAVA